MLHFHFHSCSSAITSSAIANLRSSASMATSSAVQDQKKALRSEIRKALKALSPAQRSKEGR